MPVKGRVLACHCDLEGVWAFAREVSGDPERRGPVFDQLKAHIERHKLPPNAFIKASAKLRKLAGV